MGAVRIVVQGRDDPTEITIDLNEYETGVVREVARRVNAARTYISGPTMTVTELGS